MKSAITAFAFAAFALHAAAWEFSFADAPECLVTGPTAGAGDGNQGCTPIETDDDDDHVDIKDLGNCIITFYEEPGCPLDNGEYDAFDEDECEEFDDYRPQSYDVTQC